MTWLFSEIVFLECPSFRIIKKPRTFKVPSQYKSKKNPETFNARSQYKDVVLPV